MTGSKSINLWLPAFFQGMSDHIAASHRQELETRTSQKADVVARNQDERRRELDSRIHKLVCEHEEGVIEKASECSVGSQKNCCQPPAWFFSSEP